MDEADQFYGERTNLDAKYAPPVQLLSYYPSIPTIIGVDVGAAEPDPGSTAMAKVLASIPVGSGGLIRADASKSPAIRVHENVYFFKLHSYLWRRWAPLNVCQKFHEHLILP